MSSHVPASGPAALPAPPVWLRVETLALALLVLLALLLRLPGPDLVYFNVHAARDVYRAYAMLWHGVPQFFGPELNFGGRTLGPAVYFLLLPPQLFSPAPALTYVYLALCNVLGVVFTYLAARQLLPRPLAVAAGVLAAVNPVACVAVRYLWNPVLIFPLAAVLLWGALATDRSPRRRNWAALTALGAIMMQVHFSTLFILLGTFGWLLWRRRAAFLRALPVVVGVLALSYSPAAVGFLVNPASFSNTWTTPEVVRPFSERHRFNYNAALVAGEVISIDRGENTFRSSFTHFDLMRDNQAMARRWKWPSQIGFALAPFVWALALAGLVRLAASPLRRPAPDAPEDPLRSAAPLLLAWVLVPLLALSFYNPTDWAAANWPGITRENNPPSYISTRYVYQLWPVVFFLVVVGAHTVLGWTRRAWVPLAVLGVVALFQAALVGAWIHNARTSGMAFNHTGVASRPIPTLATTEQLCKDLVDLVGIGRRDVAPDRILPGLEFGLFDLEVELDYPLRLATRRAPLVGSLADDEVLLIVRRFPPAAVPVRREYRSGPYRLLVIAKADVEQSRVYRNPWFGSYFPEGKRTLSAVADSE